MTNRTALSFSTPFLALAVAVVPAIAIAAPPRPMPKVETITYDSGPCFGTCPIYKVTVSSDGTGVFEGARFTKVVGKRAFRVDPETFAEFRNRLRGVRPVGNVQLTGSPACKTMATDMPSIHVRWIDGPKSVHLGYNLGCDRATKGWMGNVLQKAVAVLPTAGFIGPREGFSGR